MILKNVKLHNIRSYLDESIDFSEGSILLWGDIGSGKSTVLLAIEFALFGLSKGDISGGSLLRKGKTEGYVELNMVVSGKKILIKRVLKKASTGIKQDSGYIVTNGVKKEGTPVELKAEIINLLGYPKETLTKKIPIFRYTVYTPQDEMKRILFESKELRLDTLRKIFGIDKYKKIVNNSSTYVKLLREKLKKIEGMLYNFEEKKKELIIREKKMCNDSEEFAILSKKLSEEKDNVKARKLLLSEKEKDVEKVRRSKQRLEVLNVDLRNIVSQRARAKTDIETLSKEISDMKKEMPEKIDKDFISKELVRAKDKLSIVENSIMDITKAVSELTARKKVCDRNIADISSLDKCPLCKQNVAHEHKTGVVSKEKAVIDECNKEIKLMEEKGMLLEREKAKSKTEIDNLLKKEREASLVDMKLRNIKEKETRLLGITEILEKMKKDIGAINTEKMQLDKELLGTEDIEKAYLYAKKEFENALSVERDTAVKHAAKKAQVEDAKYAIEIIKKDILALEEKKKKLSYLRQIQGWLTDYFQNLMITMEKHIMQRVYHEFNDLFKDWFRALLEDDNITVRLSDEFEPVIEQNGYEVPIEDLSGGEKTSLALAYRLSLNRVINDVISSIRTKDIIILDEPTDGFSSEQLDKLRDVLEQLSTKQVIIVSHENKIESYVDNIVRVHKTGHVSKILG